MNVKLLFLCCPVCISFAISSGEAQLRTVALSGQEVPGFPGYEFTTFNGLLLSKTNAETAFTSEFVDSAQNHGYAFFSEIGKSLRPITQRGQSPPGTAEGIFFERFYPTSITRNGAVALSAELSGPNVTPRNNFGNWIVEPTDTLQTVVMSGDVAIGAQAGVRIGFPNMLSLGENGQATFRAELVGNAIDESNDEGVWRWSEDGALAKVMQEGDLVGNAVAGRAYFRLLSNPLVNSSGQIVYHSWIDGPANHELALFLDDDDNPLQVIRGVGQAPGLPDGIQLGRPSYFAPRLNDQGQLAFFGTLAGPRVNNDSQHAIWLGTADALDVIVRSGVIPAGVEDGARFFDFDKITLSQVGNVAFHAGLKGVNLDSQTLDGLWMKPFDGELTLIARSGDHSPGTPEGTVFFPDRYSPPTINDAGQVAFRSWLLGPDVDDQNNIGLWATDRDGTLRLIARNGDQLDVDDGPGIDMRTIRTLSFFAAADAFNGPLGNLNDLGQIAFSAIFSDGSSGIFVSDLVANRKIGDFNNDRMLNVVDIDLLLAEIRNGNGDLGFDLTSDQTVNSEDRDFWVHDVKGTFYGDANLDGEFNSGDLVTVFEVSEYEDGIVGNSTWATGDWNGDFEFDSSDLVLGFQDAGYEQGPRQASAFVPEPSMNILAVLGALGLVLSRRKRYGPS